jgi:integrase
MARRMTHLQRSRGWPEFRYRLPSDLAGKPVPAWWPSALDELVNKPLGRFKREIVRSVRTHDEAVAKRRCADQLRTVEIMVAEARRLMAEGPSRELTPDQSARLANQIHAEILASDEQLRRKGFGLPAFAESGVQIPVDELRLDGGLTEGDHQFLDHLYGKQSAALKSALARRAVPAETGKLAREALLRVGVDLPPDSTEFRDVALDVLSAQVRAFGDLLARQEGEIVATPPQSQGIDRGPTIRAAFAEWATGTGLPGEKLPSANAVTEAEIAVRRFEQVHGDLRVGQITRQHARTFRDALVRLPTRLPKALQKLPVLKLIDHPDAVHLPRQAAATVNKAITLLSAIVAAAVDRHDLHDSLPGWSNPFAKLQLRVETSARNRRRPFSIDELNRIFADPVIRDGDLPDAGGAGLAAKWVPLIAVFTGARREEICQLRPENVQFDAVSGRHFFEITDREEGQSVKTLSSVRRVPVHRQLVDLGFLDYLQAIRRGGHQWLFPYLKVSKDGSRGDAFGKWFGRKLNAIGIKEEPGAVFHSFRHGFVDRARDCDVPREIRTALTGHSGGQTVHDRYGHGFSIQRLAVEMDKISYPGLDLGGDGRRRPAR